MANKQLTAIKLFNELIHLRVMSSLMRDIMHQFTELILEHALNTPRTNSGPVKDKANDVLQMLETLLGDCSNCFPKKNLCIGTSHATFAEDVELLCEDFRNQFMELFKNIGISRMDHIFGTVVSFYRRIFLLEANLIANAAQPVEEESAE